MPRFSIVPCLLCALLVLSAPLSALPTVEEIFKKMAEKETKVKTVEADVVRATQTPMAQVNITGHIVCSRSEEAGKIVRKSAMTTTSRVVMGDRTMTSEMKMVNDGTNLWREMRSPMAPGVRVFKLKADTPAGDASPIMHKEALDRMRNEIELDKVTEEEIDGRKMYRIEGKLKDDVELAQEIKKMFAKITFYIDQKNLSIRRMVMRDAEGNETARMEMKNVKLNEPVDPKLFEYTPPPGVKVTDMTQDEPGQ